MAYYHLSLFLVGVSALMAAFHLVESKPVPARAPAGRSPSSLANFHLPLFGTMDDISAMPTMMVMPSFVYYQIMSSVNSPFPRLATPAKWSAMADSSEEEDEEEELEEEETEESEEMEEEEEESDLGKKELKKSTTNSANQEEERSHKKEKQKVDQSAESKKEEEKSEKDSEMESTDDANKVKPEEETGNEKKKSIGIIEVEEASQNANEENTTKEEPQRACLKQEESKAKESRKENESATKAESQATAAQEQEESVTKESEEEENSETESEKQEEESAREEPEKQSEKEEEILTTETPTMELASQESTLASIQEATTESWTESIVERMLSAAPRMAANDSAKKTGTSSVTYVCKYGKCQHSTAAKKLLEQEIEAELWAKL